MSQVTLRGEAQEEGGWGLRPQSFSDPLSLQSLKAGPIEVPPSQLGSLGLRASLEAFLGTVCRAEGEGFLFQPQTPLNTKDCPVIMTLTLPQVLIEPQD